MYMSKNVAIAKRMEIVSLRLIRQCVVQERNTKTLPKYVWTVSEAIHRVRFLQYSVESILDSDPRLS